MEDLAPPKCDDASVRKTWIIYQKPGRVPQIKIPHPQNMDGVKKMLDEMMEHYPEHTIYTIAELSYDYSLWVQSSHEFLNIWKAASKELEIEGDN